MSKLVKYHNDINNIPLRNFTEKELNLFFTIIYKAKDTGISEIKLDFIELKKLALTGREDKRLIESLDNMNRKLLSLNQKIILEDKKIVFFNLFNTFIIDPIEKNMTIEIHKNFKYMLNDLQVYTKFELMELVKLRSSYSKNMFRLLKQISKNNWRLITLEEFKRILCIPDSYRISEIDKRVLKPIIKELTPIFPNLSVEKIKKGRSIEKLKFTWGNKKIKVAEKIKEIRISEKLNKIIEKTKKNRYIKPLLSNKNIAYLTKKYSEKELIEGLNFAYNEIEIKITSLNYLEKTIESGINKEEIKLIVKKDEPKNLQGIEMKQAEQKELREETRESIKQQTEEIKKEFMDLSKEEQEEVERIAFELFISDSKVEKIMPLHKQIFKTIKGNYINKLI